MDATFHGVRYQVTDVQRAVDFYTRRLGFTLDAGPIPFAVGTPREREMHRVSRVDDDALTTIDLLAVSPVLEPT